jgi:hypothetical protein
MYDIWHTAIMRHDPESPTDVLTWFQKEAANLTPAILGSLNFRRCPCARPRCRLCESGEQHPSYVLYSRVSGRRFTLYIPEELVPEVRRGLDNGRALQELLQQATPRYINALKRERNQAQE